MHLRFLSPQLVGLFAALLLTACPRVQQDIRHPLVPFHFSPRAYEDGHARSVGARISYVDLRDRQELRLNNGEVKDNTMGKTMLNAELWLPLLADLEGGVAMKLDLDPGSLLFLQQTLLRSDEYNWNVSFMYSNIIRSEYDGVDLGGKGAGIQTAFMMKDVWDNTSPFGSLQLRRVRRGYDRYNSGTLTVALAENRIAVEEDTVDLLLGFERKLFANGAAQFYAGYSKVVSSKTVAEQFYPSDYKHGDGVILGASIVFN